MCKEYFIGAYVNRHGCKYKLTRLGRKVNSPVNLYINNAFIAQGSQKEMKTKGKEYKCAI